MSDVMPLAKNYDPKKTPYPAYLEIKYDGVPAVFTMKAGKVYAVSRQNKPLPSAQHLCNEFENILSEGDIVIAELMVRNVPDFKDAGGIIRRHEPDSRIMAVMFDGAPAGHHNLPYASRIKWLQRVDATDHTGLVHCVGTALVQSHEEMQDHFLSLVKHAENGPRPLEGVMLHDVNRPFTVGKRLWGMSRYKPQPTIDLEVVAYHEAISAEGAPLGMVGRVECLLRREGAPPEAIGVGPGKLTHAERKTLWERAIPEFAGEPRRRLARHPVGHYRIAEVKYMPDPSYSALRQPTFQRWRDDKTEGDVYSP